MKISAESHTYFCPGVGCVLYGLSGGLVVYPSALREGEMSRLPSAGVSSPIGDQDQESTGEEREDAHLILTSVLQFATY